MKIKLLKQDMTSHGGFKWELGKTYRIDKPGWEMCTDQVFHYYDSPELAVIMNPIHAGIKEPRMFECKAYRVTSDGLKGGSKSMRLIREITPPTVTIEQRVVFAIFCAKEVYGDLSWNIWAGNWLSGKDRSIRSAAVAAVVAYAVAARAAVAAVAARAAVAAVAARVAVAADFGIRIWRKVVLNG